QMFKIGVFSFLYFFPTLVLLGCFFFEQDNMDAFLMHWLGKACLKPDYGLACPRASKQIEMARKPHFSLYFIKYFAWLMPGIASGFWIWSEKTVSSWTRFFKRICCLGSPIDYV